MSLQIGVIFCAYGAEDFLAPGPECSLQPWVDIAARFEHKLSIAAVCVPFKGFEQTAAPDATESLLRDRLERGHIDHLITSAAPMSETEARGQALTWLRDEAKVDFSFMVDVDEFYHERDIRAIVAFVEANPWIVMFRVSLRNAVFTKNQFLAEPFTPPRIHSMRAPGGYVADSFYDDNNVRYWRPWEKEKMSGQPVMDVQMAHMTIPTSVAFVPHMSWLSNDRSKRKIRYQLEARGWPECSFRWDDATNSLAFNESYYQRRGLPLPEVVRA